MTKLYRTLLTALLFFAVSNCRSIQRDDIVGTWKIMGESRNILPAEVQEASGQIRLNADGTFVVSELPGLFFVPDRVFPQPDSGDGVWRLVSEGSQGELQLNFQTIKNWKSGLPYGVQLDITSGRLSYFFGRADPGQRVVLQKQ